MSDPNHNAVTVIDRAPLPDRMHPMVRAMMAQSLDPSNLREILAIQREYEAGEARREYTRAIVALKASLPVVIQHDVHVKFLSTDFWHSSLAAILAAITPTLAAHGFSVSWSPKTEGLHVTVVCRLVHAGGHHEENAISEDAVNDSKVPAKGILGTITRLKRHTVIALLGLATGDLEDADDVTPPGETIDSARNLKAIAALQKYGKSLADAIARLGREPHQWTAANLETLRAWLMAKPAQSYAPAAAATDPDEPPMPVDEPPHDPETGEVTDEHLAPDNPEPEVASAPAQTAKGAAPSEASTEDPALVAFASACDGARTKSELDAVTAASKNSLSPASKVKAREIYKRHAARIAEARHG